MAGTFQFGDKILQLKADSALLQALADIASLPDLATKVTDGHSLVAFLADGGARFKAPAIRDALPARLRPGYDLVVAHLDGLLGDVSDFAQRPVAKLLDRVGRFTDASGTDDPGLLPWTIVDTGISRTAAGNPQLTFGLSGSARIELEAGDRWPFARDITGDPALTALLRLSAIGSAGVKGQASLPFSAGSATLGASAAGEARLSYFHRVASPDTLYAVAVAEAAADLRNPFDFNDVWTGLTQTDLKGVVLKLAGSFTFDAEVAIAAGAEIASGVSVHAGLGIKANVSRSASLELSLRALPADATGARTVAVALSRASARSSTLGVDFGVTLDATQLAARVAAAVEAELGRLDDAIEPIRPFLNPGTWLRDQAAAHLAAEIGALTGDDGLNAALVADMRAALGLDAPAANVTDWLAGKVTAAIAAQADKLHQQADSVVDDVFAALQPAIPQLLATNAATAEAKIKARITALVTEYQGKVDDAVSGIFAKVGAPLAKLLGKLGVAVGDAVGSLDEAFAGIRALFAKYDALTAKIRDAIGQSAKAKLQAELTWEETFGEGSDLLISGTFTDDTDAARALYHRLLTGDLGALGQLLAPATQRTDGFVLDRENSWLSRTASWQQKRGFRLVLFGIAFDETTLLSADASIKTDGNGNVWVRARAAVQKEQTRKEGRRIVSFASPYAMSVAAATPRAIDRQLSVSFQFEQEDQNLRADDAGVLLGRLTAAGLLATGTEVRAVQLLNAWRESHGSDARLPASLKLGLLLDGPALARLMRLDQRGSGNLRRDNLPDSTRFEIVRTVVGALNGVGAFSTDRLQRARAVALAALHRHNVPGLDTGELFYHFAQGPQGIADVLQLDAFDESARDALVAFVGGSAGSSRPERGAAIRFIDAIEALGDVWQSTPASAAATGPNLWTATDYRDAEQRIAEGLAIWVERNQLFKFDLFGPRLVAALQVIGSMAGLLTLGAPGQPRPAAAPGLLTLTLSRDGPDGPQAVVIV